MSSDPTNHPSVVRPDFRRTLELIGESNLSQIDLFDVGCREGSFFKELLSSPLAVKLRKLGGLDPSAEGISETKELFRGQSRDDCHCFVGGGGEIAEFAEPNSYDIVTCLHSMNWIGNFRQVVERMADVSKRYIVVSGFVSLTYESHTYEQVLKGEKSARYQGDIVSFYWPSVFEFFTYFRGLKLVSVEYNNAWTGTPKMLAAYRQHFGWMRVPRKLRKVFHLNWEIVEPATDVTAVFEH